MEFSSSQVALLVLGFIKKEHCYNSYQTFLEDCKQFDDIREMIKCGKVSTRVAGMTLVDYFNEYSAIYHTIQVQLEETDYFVEKRPKSTLVDQLSYLLEDKRGGIKNSTPYSSSEVETTQIESLPGNSQSDPIRENSTHKTTPKRKSTKIKSKEEQEDEKDAASEALTQTFVEREIHTKLADAINSFIMPEVTNNSFKMTNEEVSAGASKELEALIKTVVQKTEEDPVYNTLIDEIIGSVSDSNASAKKPSTFIPLTHQTQFSEDSNIRLRRLEDPMEIENNNAVRSIIAASTCPEITTPSTSEHVVTNKAVATSEVFVFDGTLDSFLKSSGSAGPVQNPVYISSGGLLVVPQVPQQYDDNSKQFYLVNNNQPLLNTAQPQTCPQKQILNENDILAMPTVIVNDAAPSGCGQIPVVPEPEPKLELPRGIVTNRAPKGRKVASKRPNTRQAASDKEKQAKVEEKVEISPKGKPAQVIENNNTPPQLETGTQKTTTPRHVRNLNFSTPLKCQFEKPKDKASAPLKCQVEKPKGKAWDADLRCLAMVEAGTRPPPSKKKPTRTNRNKKVLKPLEESEKGEEPVVTKQLESTQEPVIEPPQVMQDTVPELPKEVPEEVKTIEDNINQDKEKEQVKSKQPILKPSPSKDLPVKEIEHISPNNWADTSRLSLSTPIKDGIPKTPGIAFSTTPFSQVLEEQLRGVDLISLPTPKIPITPGFALTPLQSGPFNRPTDYSTSSSYYQPSDNEQNKSIEQLIEESKLLSPVKINVISDVVVKPSAVDPVVGNNKKCNEHVKKFNHNVIGKKNLSLIKDLSSSSSDDDDDDSDSDSTSDSEKSDDEATNKTVIQNKITTVQEDNIIQVEDKFLSKAKIDDKVIPMTKIEEKVIIKAKIEEKVIPETKVDEKVSPSARVVEQVVLKAKGDNKVIPKAKLDEKTIINDIIGSVEIKETLKKAPKNMNIGEIEKIKTKLEEVRKRTIQRISKTSSSSRKKPTVKPIKPKPSPRGKAPKKIAEIKTKKPVPVKDKPKEIVEDKDEVDDETEKMIKGLWQRGIHLIPNKSPVKKSVVIETAKGDDLSEKDMVLDVDYSTPPTPSSVIFGRAVFTEDVIISHDPKATPKPLIEYDLERLEKGFSASVYVEYLDAEVNRTLRCTPQDTLIDLSPKINVLMPRRCKRQTTATKNNDKALEEIEIKEDGLVVEPETDDLMNYMITGSVREESPDARQVPKNTSSKKRKTRSSESEEKQAEKKTKNNISLKILKKIDVDNFLDKLHGGDL